MAAINERDLSMCRSFRVAEYLFVNLDAIDDVLFGWMHWGARFTSSAQRATA
jgi:RNAse (barnase) inhibitor barstar